MRVHGNAKTNVYQRRLLIRRVRQQGWTQRQAAEALGVSVRTVAKWLARDRMALADRSSRPQRQPRRTSVTVEATIVALRRTRATAWQISTALGVPRSTVTRVLQRAGLNQLRQLEPRPVVQRYEWPHAGDLVHVDIKPLARIKGVGHRITGDLSTKQRGIGYEYAHVAIDDATRLAYVEVCRTQRGDDCAAFLDRACQWFADLGVRVWRVMSDNGKGYLSNAFAAVLAQRRLRHIRTRPYTPRTNGKAERFIQTLLREWAYGRAYTSSRGRTAALQRWVMFYNRQRPHASLSYATPWARFRAA